MNKDGIFFVCMMVLVVMVLILGIMAGIGKRAKKNREFKLTPEQKAKPRPVKKVEKKKETRAQKLERRMRPMWVIDEPSTSNVDVKQEEPVMDYSVPTFTLDGYIGTRDNSNDLLSRLSR